MPLEMGLEDLPHFENLFLVGPVGDSSCSCTGIKVKNMEKVLAI
jgi:hypothetical protein